MKKNVKSKLIVFSMSLLFLACNQGDEKTMSSDSERDTTISKTTPMDNTSKDQSMDAITVAPALYKVVKDTMGIRVLDILYKPGDSSAMHSHPDVVFYVIDGGKSEFTEKDGNKRVVELKSGTTMILPATTHSVKNIGTTTVKAILFEVNRGDKAGTQDKALDATKVAPTLYKMIKDTMNIRVLMANYKPGASSAMHAHPDNAIYNIEDSKVEFTEKDGTKHQNDMTKGMILVSPGSMHSAKNIGKTNVKVLIVEVNRPAQ
jgi:quercetin dioxygenase-like cupin family protein